MRATYLFYFGARDLVLKVGIYDTTVGVPLSDVGVVVFQDLDANSTMADVSDEFEDFVWAAMWKTGNMGGLLNYGGILVVSVFVMVNFGFLALRLPSNCGGGDYLAFTWQLETTRWYRSVALFMMAFVLVAAIVNFGVSFRLISLPGILDKLIPPGKLIEIAWQDILLTFLSVLSLLSPREPVFKWQDAPFKDLRFRRSWYSFIMETNDMFADTLSSALVQAKLGNSVPLEQLLEDPRSSMDVVCICLPDSVDPRIATEADGRGVDLCRSGDDALDGSSGTSNRSVPVIDHDARHSIRASRPVFEKPSLARGELVEPLSRSLPLD